MTEEEHQWVTNLIFVLPPLVLNKKLQPLFPDLRLSGTTSAMTLLGLIVRVVIVVLGFVRLANHLALAVIPDGLHASLGIANMPDSIRERGVGLTLCNDPIRGMRRI